MPPIRCEAAAHSAAAPATVYAVAADSSGYPRWSRIGAFEQVRDGQGGRYGPGSLRIFRTWPLKLLEEVVACDPDRHIAYTMVKGLPFRDYRADIELTPAADGGTDIRWSNAFDVTLPGTRALFQRFMQGVFDEMVPQLAREAERIEREREKA